MEPKFTMLKELCKILSVFMGVMGWLLLTVCLGFSQQAGEEQQKLPESPDKKIEELLNIEVAEVFSASKTWQKVTDAPASVSVVTAKDIKKYGYRTLADILGSVRGFYISGDRNYSYLGVRGFARPGDYNTRILLLIDGHRLNDNIYDQAAIGTELPLDIDLIERVEIVRGPSSSLYGTSAFFGVVNIITRRGQMMKALELSGEIASFGSYKRRLSYGNKWKNGLELMLSGTFYDSQGVRSLYYQEFDQPATNNGIAENLDDDRAYNFFANLNYRNMTLRSVYGEREKGIPTASFQTVFNDPRLRTTDRRGYLEFQYEKTLKNQLNLLGRVSYNYYNYTGTYPYERQESNPAPFTVTTRDHSHGLWWYGELQAQKRIAARHQITVGTEFRDNFRQVQEYVQDDPYVSFLDSRKTSNNAALYLQDEFRLSDKLSLNAGIRYDHHSQFNGALNPRLGLIYNPAPNTSLKLLYGSAFRAPNAYEYFYFAEGSKFNPLLKPETIKTTEAVLEKYIGNRLRLSFSGYVYRLKGLIDYQVDSQDELIYSANVERVRAKGIEFELETRLPKGVEGRVSYALQDSRAGLSKELWTNSPRQLGKLNLSLPIVKQRLFTSLDMQYASARASYRGTPAPAYWLTNMTLLSRKVVKGFDFSLSVYNLFNRKYADPAGSEHLQHLIEQNGRNARLKLGYSF